MAAPKKIVKKSEHWAKHGKHDRAAHWWLIREYERIRATRRRGQRWFASVSEAFNSFRKKP